MIRLQFKLCILLCIRIFSLLAFDTHYDGSQITLQIYARNKTDGVCGTNRRRPWHNRFLFPAIATLCLFDSLYIVIDDGMAWHGVFQFISSVKARTRFGFVFLYDLFHQPEIHVPAARRRIWKHRSTCRLQRTTRRLTSVYKVTRKFTSL